MGLPLAQARQRQFPPSGAFHQTQRAAATPINNADQQTAVTAKGWILLISKPGSCEALATASQQEQQKQQLDAPHRGDQSSKRELLSRLEGCDGAGRLLIGEKSASLMGAPSGIEEPERSGREAVGRLEGRRLERGMSSAAPLGLEPLRRVLLASRSRRRAPNSGRGSRLAP